MLHDPAAESGPDHAQEYKSRLGVRMFLVYAVIYVGFVAINIISPPAMEKTILLGLNLAVVYGFGLIIIALIMALFYNRACTLKEKELNTESGETS
ncbi:MAG: DUF485 domain-containing protein [Candidatus Krumholzibacteria bacterium]|nr:DUF485 domain-containing protein [Candidatus Krumholzibacteria bacterium]